ncbi:hypothetical protein ScPMuIL_018002 [Solemya velum]
MEDQLIISIGRKFVNFQETSQEFRIYKGEFSSGICDLLMGRPSVSELEEHTCSSTQLPNSENLAVISSEIMDSTHQRLQADLRQEVRVLVQPECSRRLRSLDVASLCGQMLRVMGDEQVSHTCGRHLRCMGDHLYHHYTLHKLLPKTSTRRHSVPTST